MRPAGGMATMAKLVLERQDMNTKCRKETFYRMLLSFEVWSILVVMLDDTEDENIPPTPTHSHRLIEVVRKGEVKYKRNAS